MASGITNTLRNALLNHVFRGQAYTGSAIYVGLLSVMPTASSDGTEIVFTGYARKALGTDVATGGDGRAYLRNPTRITFFNNGWGGTCVAVGFYTALTGGSLLWWDPLATSITFPGNTPGLTLHISAMSATLYLDYD